MYMSHSLFVFKKVKLKNEVNLYKEQNSLRFQEHIVFMVHQLITKLVTKAKYSCDEEI